MVTAARMLEQPAGCLERVRALEAAVRQLADRGANDALGVVEELLHRRGDAFPAAPRAQLRDALLGESVRSQLRAEVSSPLVGIAHPRDE